MVLKHYDVKLTHLGLYDEGIQREENKHIYFIYVCTDSQQNTDKILITITILISLVVTRL